MVWSGMYGWMFSGFEPVGGWGWERAVSSSDRSLIVYRVGYDQKWERDYDCLIPVSSLEPRVLVSVDGGGGGRMDRSAVEGGEGRLSKEIRGETPCIWMDSRSRTVEHGGHPLSPS